MKLSQVFVIATVLSLQVACTKNESEKNKEKAGYALGVRAARDVKSEDVDVDDFIEGLKDGLKYEDLSKLEYNDTELRDAVRKNRERRDIQNQTPEEKQLNATFDEIAKKPNMTVISRNFLIETLREGKGVTPGRHDTAVVKYKLMDLKGKVLEDKSKEQAIPVRDLPHCLRMATSSLKAGVHVNVYCTPRGMPHVKAMGLSDDTGIVFDFEIIRASKSN